ncbi:MAG: sulfotransferase [Phycisphaerales bacterium]|jgi:hypothetical protein|nr:sulfotransferase [Phycisphaerales bacterium]
MTLPSFLIIGAMKSGTTTLFEDLATHPDIFEPLDKEPGDLKSDDVLTPEGRAAYERHFQNCRPGQLAFEASTHYTQMPQWTGAAERARSLLGSDVRVLYIVREPVSRACSHHRHLVAAGLETPDMDEAVRINPLLIEYSRYATQLEPWIATFGTDQIRVIKFESYITDRATTAADIQAFLGLEPMPDLVATGTIANASKGKMIHTEGSRRVAHAPLYRKIVRPLTPRWLKRAAKRGLMRTAATDVIKPSVSTVQAILDATEDDVQRIAPLLHPAEPPGGRPWSKADAMSLARDPETT